MSIRKEDPNINKKKNISFLGQYYQPPNSNIKSYLESSNHSKSLKNRKKIKVIGNFSHSNEICEKSLIHNNTRNTSNSEYLIKTYSNSFNKSIRGKII